MTTAVTAADIAPFDLDKFIRAWVWLFFVADGSRGARAHAREARRGWA